MYEAEDLRGVKDGYNYYASKTKTFLFPICTGRTEKGYLDIKKRTVALH